MTVPNFKDIIAADLSTFLNPNEFSETHLIMDREVIAQVDSITLKKHPLDYAEGVSLLQKHVYVAHEALGFIPNDGSQFNLDDEWYTVISVSLDAGLLFIVLEENSG
ncbi:hypothetical protein ACHHV8_33530 [Paenibacillus sp. TAB 01]|uniref:hypothetical protein n=1 Tax=Paenibacillus sp. TAB 01 TaxID=3368988 RepID=UPI0037516520